ncbi:GNAT family N-acetyltransferase [uncultured Rikenella sp.]|uniref:GNAT family N-acetyltransferase n=1 Tax=uncultured Rikenella sp. TaxID=368003 RepID=UPI0025D58B09|nr:GNAT family N-acetyltransferase [uncultured Rikenella sp.]
MKSILITSDMTTLSDKTLDLIRLDDHSHPLAEAAWAIYEQSFPLCEQRPLAEHLRALGDPAFHYHLLIERGRLVGLLSWWDWETDEGQRFRFGEHFAIAPEKRGGGYGSQALKLLQGDGSRLLLLEIDPPQDEVSRRRERFYLSNGMCPNYDYDHVHPSFRPTTEPHRLFLMSYPRPLTEAEFRAFQRFNNERVLSYSERK